MARGPLIRKELQEFVNRDLNGRVSISTYLMTWISVVPGIWTLAMMEPVQR